MDAKKLVCVFLVVHVIFGTSTIGLLGLMANSQQKNVLPRAMHLRFSSYELISSRYSGIPFDLYIPNNFTSGSFVLLAGGILGEKHYLRGWAAILAEHGYASLAFSTKAEDLQHVPEYVNDCRQNIQTLLPFIFNDALFPISINQSAVFLVGMSGGAATVLSLNDTRLQAKVAVCPYYIEELAVKDACPTLIVTGETDPITPPATNGDVYYEEIVPSKMMATQVGVGHDISDVGWKYVFAWFDYYRTSDSDAYSTLTSVADDSEILNYMDDF